MNGSPKFKAKQTPSRLVDRVPTGGSDSLNVNEHATGATLSLARSLAVNKRTLIALARSLGRRRCVLPLPRVFVNIKGTINLFLSNSTALACEGDTARGGRGKATRFFCHTLLVRVNDHAEKNFCPKL